MANEDVYGSPGGGDAGQGSPLASPETASEPQGSQPSGQEPTANEPTYVTKEELEKAMQEVQRTAQSMTDKMGSRLDKEIQNALAEANRTIEINKAAGVTLTPEQEQAIRDRSINGAYSRMNQPQGDSSPQPSAQPQQPTQPQEPGDQPKGDPFVQQEVQRIMTETGVYIPPDVANQLIGPIGKERTPYQWVQAFETLARQRQSNQPQRGPSPAIPTYASGGRSTSSQTALRQQYEKERQQIRTGSHPSIRRGDLMGIQRLENEYRQKGLDV